MRWFAAFLLLFAATTAAAQTCPVDPTGGAGADMTAINGWTVSAKQSRPVWHLEASFYLMSEATSVAETFYGNAYNTNMDTDATFGIRFDSDGKIKFMQYHPTDDVPPEWTCDDNETGGVDPNDCPTYTAGTWYRFDVTRDIATRVYTVDVTECDGVDTPTKHASYENFYAPRHPSHNAGVVIYPPQYYGLQSNSFSQTFSLYGMSWNLVEVETNCAANDSVGTTEVATNIQGRTFTPCPAPSPSLCPGQTFASWDVPDVWDWLARIPVAHAITNGSAPLNPRWGTATVQGCTGTVIGPHRILTAHHCVAGNESQGEDPNSLSPTDSFYAFVEEEFFPVSRAILHPDVGSADDKDQAILWVGETLPPPYIDAFDPQTDAAGCTDMVMHGGGGETSVTECQYKALWDTSAYRDGYLGYCTNPLDAYSTGGDSGGPVYAVGDWGSGAEARLVSTTVGGPLHHRSDRVDSAWMQSNVDPPALHTFGDGTVLDNFWVDRFPDGSDSVLGTVLPTDRTCHFSVTGSVDYVGCTFVNVAEERISCVDHVPPYSCTVTLPQGSGPGWEIERVYIPGYDVDRATLDAADALTVFHNNMDTVPARDNLSPTVDRFVPPQHVAPGGTADCSMRAVDTAARGVRHRGCVIESGPSALVAKFSPTWESQTSGQYHVNLRVPEDATPGSTWTATAFIQDNGLRSGSEQGTFSIYDCAASATDEHVGADSFYGNQSKTPVGGYNAVYKFYARASATDAQGYVVLSETTIASLADATHGIRFGPTGTIDVLDNGAWVSTGQTFTADTWYRFFLYAQEVTAPATQNQPTYDVWMSECGSEASQVYAGAVANGGERILEQLDTWNVYAATGQTIGVNHPDWAETYCYPTQCLWEGWSGGSFPDGCGGTLSC